MGVGGPALKSPRTWSPVCHADCSDAIECGQREQKVHRTPAILMQSLSEASPSAVHPPHAHPSPNSALAEEIHRFFFFFLNGHTLTEGKAVCLFLIKG